MAFFSHTLFFYLHLVTATVIIFQGYTPVLSCYTSIFSFGDSLIDTGNLLYIDPSHVIGHYPYGETYFKHPTGRSSNGRLVIDFIAESFGIPYVPPYLVRGRYQDLRWGADFAVAGATALDDAFYEERNFEVEVKNVSFGTQIRWFKDLLPSLCQTPSGCRDFLRSSLLFVGQIGGNDYYHPFQAGATFEEIQSYVPEVVNVITSAVDTLIKHGATVLVVPGMIPLGCLAIVLTMGMSPNKEDYEPDTGCIKIWNHLAEYHNELLMKELNRLRVLHPHATIIYADYLNVAMQVYRSPLKFGFPEGALRACCGGGGPYNYNASALCGSRSSKGCDDPSLYFTWDASHNTEAGNQIIANGFIQGPYTIPPITSPCLSLAPPVLYSTYQQQELFI